MGQHGCETCRRGNPVCRKGAKQERLATIFSACVRERKREPTEKELESVLQRLEKEREKERESLLDDEVRQLCEEIDSAACCLVAKVVEVKSRMIGSLCFGADVTNARSANALT